MRISESRIRQIIRQSLRDFILESTRSDRDALEREYFGRSKRSMSSLVQALLKTFVSGHQWPPDAAAMSDIQRRSGKDIKFLGAGVFRAVFSIGNDLVLKISLDSITDIELAEINTSANKMNKDDFTLGTDRELGHIFPRAYMHGPHFSWVVLERVKPVETDSQFILFFPSSLLPDPKTLSAEDQKVYSRVISGALNFKSRYFGDNKLLKSFPGFSLSWGSGDKTLGELREDLLDTSAAFAGFAKAINKYQIDSSELRFDNLGIGDDGRLVLLDSSIFPDR